MSRQAAILVALLAALLAPATALASIADAIISVDDAKAKLGQPNVVFVYGGSKEGFEANHIPGTYYAFPHDMQFLDDVQACDGLPMCKERAAEFIGGLGIDNETSVIAYGDGKGANESGVWFFLLLYGHQDVKIMEGGVPQWQEKGYPLEAGAGTPPAKKTFEATVVRDMIVNRSEVEAAVKDDGVMILDARHEFGEFVGKDLLDGLKNATEQFKVPRGGHIPGAVFSPWTKYAGNKAGKPGKPLFKSVEQLQKQLEKLEKKGYAPDKDVVTYCHVGLGRGSFQYLGLMLAGHEKVKLYVGSWSEWGSSDLPIETETAADAGGEGKDTGKAAPAAPAKGAAPDTAKPAAQSKGGCGCRQDPRSGSAWALGLFGLVIARRRSVRAMGGT